MNRKGLVEGGVLVAVAIISGIIAIGFNKTAQDGTLKKNGKKIWCKVMNKGESYCNALYK